MTELAVAFEESEASTFTELTEGSLETTCEAGIMTFTPAGSGVRSR
jgi:hypothetical protein